MPVVDGIAALLTSLGSYLSERVSSIVCFVTGSLVTKHTARLFIRESDAEQFRELSLRPDNVDVVGALWRGMSQ
jgi:hypothetical protein